MDEHNLKPLEVSAATFIKLIKKGAIYVDKTKMILELLKSDGPYFLSRPRRFGKSVLVDTLQQIFEGKKELFDGLDIAKLAPHFDWNPHPVIRIDMNYVSIDPDKFQHSIISKLAPIADSYEVDIYKDDLATSISDLIINISNKQAILLKQADRLADVDTDNVVLLIDEYDFPLIGNLENPLKIEEMRKHLHSFYSAIKGCMEYLRFVFITGVTKFRQLSLFSALNNVEDITFNPEFSTICGFTREEIESSYREHLANALFKQIGNGELPPGSESGDLMRKITDWYDGYSWDGQKKVFNPFAIKSFLKYGEFDDYWYNSGVSVLTALLDSPSGNFFTLFGHNLSATESSIINDTQNIHNEAFLLQAGYLTVESISGSGKDKTYRLKIPNKEIKDAIDSDLKSKLQQFLFKLEIIRKGDDSRQCITNLKDDILEALWSRDSMKSEMFMSSIFSGISRDLYRGGGENYFNIILHVLFRYGGSVFDGDIFKAMTQILSDAGKSDLVLDVHGGGYIVIELKYIPPHPSLEIPQNEPSSDVITSTGKAFGQSDNESPSFHPSSHQPISVTGLIELGKISPRLKLHLERKAEEAFEQIRNKNYAKYLYISKKPILAVAIVIYRTSTVLVRFRDVLWTSGNETDPDVGAIQLQVPDDSGMEL
ncbi:MAG: AAA family ATPase [Deltaproteobacteria bacterium]|jgi:hypothetical protein|nr:AAA family ATPase [Deltaproteobacteria bacterium]